MDVDQEASSGFFHLSIEKSLCPFWRRDGRAWGRKVEVLACLICVRVKWKIARFCGSGDGRGAGGWRGAASDPNHREATHASSEVSAL